MALALNCAPMSSDTDTRQPRRQLWLIAQHFITTLFAVFGAPEAIATRHTLVREQCALIAKWLRAGETLMRQLLLIEAAALPKPNTRPLLRKSRARKRRVMHFSAEEPQAWRVSFRCFSSPACGGSVSARSATTMGPPPSPAATPPP